MHTPSSYSTGEGSTSPSISLQSLWIMLLRHLWLFFLCFIPVLLLTIIYLIRAPRLYESTAVVQVEQQEQRAFRSIDKEGQPEDLKSDDVIKTIEQNLQNYSLFVNVVSDPKIAGDPDFLVGYSGNRSPDNLANWLRSNTKVALRHGTRLIDVTVDHRVATMAQKLAQALVSAFVLQTAEAQNVTDQSALKFLVAQSAQLKESLQRSEDSLQLYKDSLLLRDRIDDQQRVLDALRQRYREKHPQLIQARMLLADLMMSFDQDFKRVSRSKGEAAFWASNNGELASVAPADRIPTELKLVEARAEVLQKEVDTESALFDNILKQMRETGANQESTPTEIRLIESPPLPDKPAKPKKTVVLLLGSAIGFILGVGAVALANAMDSTIKTTTEAEQLTGLTVIGAIPRLPSEKTKRAFAAQRAAEPSTGPAPDDLVVLSDPGGAAAEGFRSLRASVNLLGNPQEHRSILFTSALPGEGKTFISCNFALGLGQAGLKTLLIDTDLRRPSVHLRCKLQNTIGFMEVATKGVQLSEAIHTGVGANLDVLTAGGKCSNPAELLSGPKFKEILAQALTTYDRVVLDCSPVNMVSDSLLVAPHVQRVCFVIRADSTPRQASQYALTLLRRAKGEISGVVLNAVPPWSDRLYLGYADSRAAAYRQTYT